MGSPLALVTSPVSAVPAVPTGVLPAETALEVQGGDGAASPADSAEHVLVARGNHGVDAWADGEMSSEGEGTELEDEQLLSSHGS